MAAPRRTRLDGVVVFDYRWRDVGLGPTVRRKPYQEETAMAREPPDMTTK